MGTRRPDTLSPQMKRVEKEFCFDGESLRDFLIRGYNKNGLPLLAAMTRVNKGTLWYWFLKFGIHVETKAVG